ncbi:receptor-type tyrosine-protein phosphatase kappa-like [Haliotis rufescens]|uniref:receptor-type tyrosine-protein phosphatase kappa-like n=1 Tax=Haliotis rufescens TaxID=6454 RepID=UPI00201E8A0B|nr:receptor-type tyrosine-protein phosphatase kappa-like [Haliotis rufescens]
MTNMGKKLLRSFNAQLLKFKVMCGLSMDSAAKEEKAVASVCQDPIPVARFLHTLRQKKSDKQLNIEVRAIVRNQEEFPCTTAMSPRNINFNIKQEVVTYDHSRVILWDVPPHIKNDYINSSFIDGYYLTKEYIAAQGPTSRTLAAFWHMIWQEGVHCVVMATGLFENAAQQCEKYWDVFLGVKKYVRHGDIHIWNKDAVFMAQLNIRTFRIQKEGSSEERVVRHFEMLGFHDNECADPGFILDVRRRVSSFMSTSSGPVLVHCRCGGGRTAVFIAVDYCLKQIEAEERVDIYSCVLHLRRFRKNMVRTLGQYRLIYDTMAMYLQTGWTVCPATLLPATYLRYYSKNAEPKQQKLDREFQTLHTVVPRLSIGDCASGHRVENRSKSRDIMMLPPERARPYLMTNDSGDSGTDFINAVYVDGYSQENTYLCTQWPKKNTVNDIWRLLYDYKINTLVILNDVKFSRSYPRFWPKQLEDESKYGPIAVKYLGCGRYTQIVIRAFSIRKSTSKAPSSDDMVVKMFQITGSSSRSHIHVSAKSLTYVMHCADQWQRKTNPLNPICVMSKDGSCRIGIYCGINICSEQLKTDGEVDIFNAVRLIKRNRPQLVPNIDEYRYIYQFMAEFAASSGAKPQIVITGSEGEATNYAFEDNHCTEGESSDDDEPPSQRSSRSGSFDTALDDPMDCYVPATVNAQAKLSACITQLTPHMSPQFFKADRWSYSSTDSLCGFETASESNRTALATPDSVLTNDSHFTFERNNNFTPEKRLRDKFSPVRVLNHLKAPIDPTASNYG